MKTIIIYNDIVSPLRMVILEGDYSRFNGICVNSTNSTGFEEEFCEFFFNETGGFNFELSENIDLLSGKGWDKVAIVTFLP